MTARPTARPTGWPTHYPGVRLVRLERNSGFCAAANAGIAAARGQFIQLLNNDTEVSPGWMEAGLAPFADPMVGSVAPLVLVRSDPSRVDSAGDSYTLGGWPTKRGHGQPADRWTSRPIDEVFAASGSSAFYRAEAIRRVGGFDPLSALIMKTSTWASACAGPAIAACSPLAARSCTRSRPPTTTLAPALQRRIARNAELVFWSNMPAGRLPAAFLAHAALSFAQAGWRMTRLNFLPFFLGKLDALRSLPAIRQGASIAPTWPGPPSARPTSP